MTNTPNKDQANDQPRQGPTIQHRRKILILLVLLTCGGYGVPRIMLHFSAHISESPATPSANVYDKFRRKARLVKTIGQFPGHKNAAANAYYALRRKTTDIFKAQAKHPTLRSKATRYQLYINRTNARRSSLKQRMLCQEQRFDLLNSLIYPSLDLPRFYDLPRYVRLGAMQQAHTARLAQLTQYRLQHKKLILIGSSDMEAAGLALIAAGRNDLAIKLFAKAHKRVTSDYHRRYLGQAICGLKTSLGLSSKGQIDALEPHCRAIQAWALTRRGRGDLALQQLPHWSSMRTNVSDPMFLSVAAALAQQKRWYALGRLVQKHMPHLQYNTFGKHDIFNLFNHIFTHTTPPSLLALIQSQLEAHLQAPGTPELGLAKMHNWLLVAQGRQALLLGEPRRAAQLLRQALSQRPQQPNVAMTWAQIEGLTKGPKAALALMATLDKGLRKSAKQQRQWYLLWAIYAAYTSQWAQVKRAMKGVTCHKLDSDYQGTCRLLHARLAQEKRKAMVDPAAKQKAAKIDYAESDPMIRLLNTPPKLRSAKAIEHTLRYIHPSNPSPGLHARLLLYQLLDPSGKLAARYIPSWHCHILRVAPKGHVLTAYLLERLATRLKQPKERQEVFTRRRRAMGQFYRKVAELWLPSIGI